MPVDDGGEAAPIADGASATAGRLTWDCGDELLEKLAGAEREALREAISAEVLAALQYHSTTEDLDHVLIYLLPQGVAIDLQLPGCCRQINLRQLLQEELEILEENLPGTAAEIRDLESLFTELAEMCSACRRRHGTNDDLSGRPL